MKNNIFNIKNLRQETLKITSKELAARLEISEDELNGYEKEPQNIPFGVIVKITEEFGIPLEYLCVNTESHKQQFNIKNSWAKIREIKDNIEVYLDINSDILNDDQQKEIVNAIKATTAKLTAKPKIIIIGRSDSGKSSMCNQLLGADELPADWQPMTAIIVYIKHINDRPRYMKDHAVWIFKNDSENQPWNDSKIQDEEYTKSLLVAAGDKSLLSLYGTREGEEYEARENGTEQISSAVLFIDSPILNCCDILDVPGFTGGRPADEQAAMSACSKGDILIYLSQSNSFMCKEDFVYLKSALENIPVIDNVKEPSVPKLANLFVVATQAHIIDYGNEKKIKKILDNGCERFYSTLTEKFWDRKTKVSGNDYTKEDMRKRFFSYTTDIKRLREEFENSLRTTLEIFPESVEEKIKNAIKLQKDNLSTELSEKLKNAYYLRDENDTLELKYKTRIAEEPKIKGTFNEKRKYILEEICQSRRISVKEFTDRFNRLFDADNLIGMMKKRKVRNTKSSKEAFLTYIFSKSDEECANVITKEAEKLKPELDEYTEQCQKCFDSADIKIHNPNNSRTGYFDVKRAFVSGISGAATYGALAVWASSLGNLGSYIIATKAVSLLATLGIHLGGTAAVVSTISALGGPVAWGLGLALLVGTSIFGILNNGWRKRFAKSITDEVYKNDILKEYIKAIDTVWDDTESAFNLGADNVIAEWDKQTLELKKAAEKYDSKAIENRIRSLEAVLDLLNGLPIDTEFTLVFNV